jgi:hypothetical protein
MKSFRCEMTVAGIGPAHAGRHLIGAVVIGGLVMLCNTAAFAQGKDVRVVFLEPAAARDTSDAPVYEIVTDSTRVTTFEQWMANESARMACDLYARAWALTPQGRRGEPSVYYVALVPGGNNAAVGLRLLGDAGPEAHAHTSFIKLASRDWAFSTTLLHETGHVILSMLNGGSEIPRRPIAAISHTTAALTDRGTAFDEGFAIHLETLAAHFTTDDFLKDRYHHRRFRFGAPDMLGEFHRHAGDLLSFSQTVARYYEVRENDFAFAPAFIGPDYLRVQLEKSRDFASLRDANQLLQSEGFYASFFFSLLMSGKAAPTIDTVRERQQKVLEAMAEMLSARAPGAEDPFVLRFVETYLRMFPREASAVIVWYSTSVMVCSSIRMRPRCGGSIMRAPCTSTSRSATTGRSRRPERAGARRSLGIRGRSIAFSGLRSARRSSGGR